MAFHPFRHHRRNPPADEPVDPLDLAALSAEAEAYVAGRLADHFAETGRKVPIWSLLNRLAHGTVDEIAELLTTSASRGWRAHPSAAGWIVQERALALRLLQAAPTDDALRRIQSVVLVPVELEMIARNLDHPVSPDAVAFEAARALDNHLLDR